ASTTMPNAHSFIFHGADVTLRSDGSAASTALIAQLNARNLIKRTQYVSGTIPAGGTTGIGWPLIDFEQTVAIGDAITEEDFIQVIAHSAVFGTVDGGNITSDPFDFPVTVCKGCLIEDLGPCATLSSSVTIHKGGVCNKLQDSLFSCCE